MAWGKKLPGASNVGTGPFAADYNANYDGHTEHGNNNLFAVNPPSYSDVGPYEYSGIGPDPVERKYKMPSNVVPDQGAHNGEGYLGDAIGPREIQTGNAPSGAYATRPGLGFASWLQKGVFPDNRRAAERTRRDDWEANQDGIHLQRDAELRSRRTANVRESWVEFDAAPTTNPYGPPVNAIEDSPYRKDWSDKHGGPGGASGSMTWRTNPNRFRNFDRYDFAAEKATSGSRYLNGTHYSMAVHQTLTPYGPSTDGANPVRALRNTYRIQPAPWDTTNTDGPANTPSYTTTTSLGADGSGGSPSYRLM